MVDVLTSPYSCASRLLGEGRRSGSIFGQPAPNPRPASGERGWGRVLPVVFALLAAPAPAATLGYVTEQGADSVAVVDIDAWKVLDQIKVGKKPAGVAVAPGGSRIYVSNPDSPSVTAIARGPDGSHKVVAEGQAGQGPLGLATDREGKFVFAADWYNDTVHVLDAESLKPLRVLHVGKSPSGMTTSSDNRRLYVANRESDTISVIDLTSWETLATIPVGKAPFGMTWDDNGPRLWVANVQSSDVSVVDPVAFKETRRVPVRTFPYGVAVTRDGARAFVTNQHDDSVSALDGKTYESLAVLKTGAYPEGILIAPDQRHVLVSCWMDDELQSIDIATLKIDRELPVLNGPRAFGQFIAPDR